MFRELLVCLAWLYAASSQLKNVHHRAIRTPEGAARHRFGHHVLMQNRLVSGCSPLCTFGQCGGGCSAITRVPVCTPPCGFGHCVSGSCVCHPGYTGSDCSTIISGCIPPCVPGQGTCRGNTLPAHSKKRGRSWLWPNSTTLSRSQVEQYGHTSSTCNCDPGFTGTNCSTKIPACNPQCVHGNCVNGNCRCYAGYSGDDCSIPDCSPRCVNGKCVRGSCNCVENYLGIDCTTWSPVGCGIANPAKATRIKESPNRGRLNRGRLTKGRSNKRRTLNPKNGTASLSTRILGGMLVSPPRKYPWQVSLQQNDGSDRHFCGGSIIAADRILTAAHCLLFPNCTEIPVTKYRMKIGEHILWTNDDDNPSNTKTYNVRKAIIHRSYRCKSATASEDFPKSMDNDFAILELDSQIPFNNVIRPVCLPEDDSKNYAGDKATVSGWGNLAASGPSANTLREVEVEIEYQAACKWDGWTPKQLPDSQLCTTPLYVKGSCYGDSRGPLVVKKGGRYIQVGVVSYGPADCDDTTLYYSIHARVSNALTWIRNNLITG